MDKKIIKTKTDSGGNVYLDLKDFKDFIDIKKIDQYALEEVFDENNKVLVLTFYDKKGKIVKTK
jgi:hypothetical protein